MHESIIGAYINANELENKIMEITNIITELCIKNPPTNRLVVIPAIAIVIHCLVPNTLAIFPESAPTVAAKT